MPSATLWSTSCTSRSEPVLVAITARIELDAPASQHSATISSETRDRIRAGIRNSGLPWPNQPVAFDITPTDPVILRDPALDLPLALAALVASGVVPIDRLRDTIVLGEIGLDGAVRPLAGTALTAAHVAVDTGLNRIIAPTASVRIPDAVLRPTTTATLHGADTLRDVVTWARGDNNRLTRGGNHRYVHEAPPTPPTR